MHYKMKMNYKTYKKYTLVNTTFYILQVCNKWEVDMSFVQARSRNVENVFLNNKKQCSSHLFSILGLQFYFIQFLHYYLIQNYIFDLVLVS